MRVAYQVILTLAISAWMVVAGASVTVSIDQGEEYQTVLGWGATSWSPPWITDALREEIILEAVNDFGLTRLRLEGPGGNRSNDRRWEWLNDNWDPTDINWAAFNTARLDERVSGTVAPFKQRVEANGEPFNLYVSPSFFDGGSTGEVPPWLLNSPGEYAEFAISFLLHLKNVHGIEADYYCILNEAGNNNPFSAAVVGRMIKALGPKLKAHGLKTRIQFPECVSASASWDYIQALKDDPEVWRYVGAISYHLYGSNDPYRSYIRDFAISRGLPTGQTEYMGLTMDHLYDDLTLGGVSYWEIYGITSQFDLKYNGFSRKDQYWNFRQVLHYVRPGAVRVQVTSSDPNLRVLAFVKDSKTTVVLINGAGSRTVEVRNLPAGTYGVCQSVSAAAYRELGLRTISAKDALTVTLPANTVATIYPYPGTNQPPTFTDWRAASDYLTMPASSTTLSASATDPELEPIAYAWSVKTQPLGANVLISKPTSSTTSATGLTVPGEYVFTVAASDASNTVTRDVRLTVFAENQPPLPDDVHNRIPVVVTLPASSTRLRGYGWDLEGDPVTYRWSVVSQPPGAKVSLANPTTGDCTASNMTVPGDYVFSFDVTDPTHTVSEELTVPVYPANPSAPLIKSITASPSELTLPASSRTLLSATTSDPDGDMISHWWSVKSAPSGSSPVFADEGSSETGVTRLTIPGTYVFTLTVVDRTKYATRDVTVTVRGHAAAPTVEGFGIETDNAVSLVWTDFASAYTVEVATDLLMADWEVINPVDQWPILTTSWAGEHNADNSVLFFRVAGQ